MGAAVWMGFVGALVGLGVAGCGESAVERMPAVSAAGAGGSSAGSGAGGASGSSGSAGSGGLAGNAGALGLCPGPAPAGPKASGRLDLPVHLTVNGADLVVGEAAVTRAGSELGLSLFKFFLTQPKLLGAGGTEVEAELVGEAGLPLPYGLALIDADDESTQLLRLAAPAGTYEGLRISVGVPEPCNGGDPTTHVYPLNADSDMWWTWGDQYMFVRVEGNRRVLDAAEPEAFFYHVGFQPAFVTVTLPAALSVGASPTTATVKLGLDVDRLIEPRSATSPVGKHDTFEGWIIDNIDDNQVFSLQ